MNTSTYYILYTESGVHQPRPYDSRRNGDSVKTYNSLDECQTECDRLNAEEAQS